MSEPRAAPVGPLLNGRYTNDYEIARGGQGAIFAGRDTRTGRDVAIKQLVADPSAPGFRGEVARFRRAGRIRIGHPAVLDPMDSFEDKSGGLFIVFEFLQGADLGQCIARQPGPCEIAQLTAIVRGIAGGLGAIHARGIVHRDIKPKNIFLKNNGDLQILDFGIAKVCGEETVTTPGTVVGSPRYMAPEQFRTADVDHRADLYALGAILYELMTGVPLRSGVSDLSVRNQANAINPPHVHGLRPDLPQHLVRLCSSLLAHDPDQRPQSADEVIAALGSPTSCVVKRCLACGGRVQSASSCGGCGRPFPRAPMVIEFVSGPAAAQMFLVPVGQFQVGREQICPQDRRISRRQFAIGCRDGQVWIRDAGACNPTRVDGCKLAGAVALAPCRRLSIADNTAVVTVGSSTLHEFP
jgi:hypothetical protein